MLTPEEIQAREFTLSRRGYDRADVRNFLARVGGDIERLLQRVRQLEGDLAAEREARAQQAQAAPAAVAPQPDPAAEHLEQASAMFADISRETQRILEAAQEAGSQITRKAKHEAERELQGARVQAAKLIAEGERRRETIERALNGMDSSRSDLAAQLRKVGGTVERLLRDLDPQPESATTMRAALSQEARTAPDEVSAPGSGIATEDDRRPPESERLATAWGGRAELVRSRGDSGGDEALDPEPDTEEAQTLSGEPIVR
ncbi:MAG TPA: DivIVA domain-containing protein, partial [Egibacteraceae bacterium]|nr:DivIVA domain-containing protein [Egibacteraceae bacterium]